MFRIDGSKFKAVNNRDKNYTVAKVTGRMEQVNASIARYLRALDRADHEESDIAEAKSVRLKEKIAGLRQQMQALKVMEQTVQDAPDQQVSLTDPDARSILGQAYAIVKRSQEHPGCDADPVGAGGMPRPTPDCSGFSIGPQFTARELTCCSIRLSGEERDRLAV